MTLLNFRNLFYRHFGLNTIKSDLLKCLWNWIDRYGRNTSILRARASDSEMGKCKEVRKQANVAWLENGKIVFVRMFVVLMKFILDSMYIRYPDHTPISFILFKASPPSLISFPSYNFLHLQYHFDMALLMFMSSDPLNFTSTLCVSMVLEWFGRWFSKFPTRIFSIPHQKHNTLFMALGIHSLLRSWFQIHREITYLCNTGAILSPAPAGKSCLTSEHSLHSAKPTAG